MKKQVILYRSIPEDLRKRLDEHFVVKYHPLTSKMPPEFYEDLEYADGIIGSKLTIDEEFLNKAPRLRMIANTSVGYDNLDIRAITKRGIMASNTPDVLTDTVADTMMGLLISTARRMPEMHQYVQSGKWDEIIGEELFGVDVHHKKLGIIGMGKIGTAIAERAHLGFKMDILYYNRSRNERAETELKAKKSSLDELLRESDFILVMAPLTEETYNLIGKREFELMKNSAIFINGSRGELIDEQALITALENKEILAAGLDVYQEEPLPLDSPLLGIDNLVTFPHLGSTTKETRYKMIKLAVDNLIKGLQGEVPPTIINPEVLDNSLLKDI